MTNQTENVVEQESAAEVETPEVQAKPKPAKKKARAKRKPAAKRTKKRAAPTGDAPVAKKKVAKKARTPGVTLANADASDVIKDRLGDEINEYFVLTSDQKKNAIGAIRTCTMKAINKLAKKEREKAVNVFSSLHRGKSPSVYTVLAIQHLANEGEATITALRDMYLGAGYKTGTARRHAQMMAGVLPALRVATRDGNKLAFNAQSTIAQAVMSNVQAEAS